MPPLCFGTLFAKMKPVQRQFSSSCSLSGRFIMFSSDVDSYKVMSYSHWKLDQFWYGVYWSKLAVKRARQKMWIDFVKIFRYRFALVKSVRITLLEVLNLDWTVTIYHFSAISKLLENSLRFRVALSNESAHMIVAFLLFLHEAFKSTLFRLSVSK